jgi:hypothetical protein
MTRSLEQDNVKELDLQQRIPDTPGIPYAMYRRSPDVPGVLVSDYPLHESKTSSYLWRIASDPDQDIAASLATETDYRYLALDALRAAADRFSRPALIPDIENMKQLFQVYARKTTRRPRLEEE